MRPSVRFPAIFKTFCSVLCFAAFFAGCNSTGMQVTTHSGPTKVVVLLTSTANGQLANFNVAIGSILLADKSGNTVSLYTNPNVQSGLTGNVEFMHLNGVAEPITVVSVPQGSYTSAVMTVGNCSFSTISVTPVGGLLENTDAEGVCVQGSGQATVQLASPITVSGDLMAISVNLQVSQSYTIASNVVPPSYTISPTFTLTPVSLPPQPSKDLAASLTGIAAVVTSINAANNSFVAGLPDGFSLTVNANSSTAFQGVAAFSTLAVGTLVNLDLSIQQDASLLATRVEVDDLGAVMNSIGPYVFLGAQPGEFSTFPSEASGCTITGAPFCGSVFQYDANTRFGFSSQFTNLADLPFTPAFSGPGLVFGQRLSLFASGQFNAINLEPVTAAILYPQIVNGTVTGVSNAGSFTVYSVALAPYDIFPTLQTMSCFIIRLNNPTNVVQVYVDSSTQILTTSNLAAGSLVRVRGLVFDDKGTLRMDANLVRDGVPE